MPPEGPRMLPCQSWETCDYRRAAEPEWQWLINTRKHNTLFRSATRRGPRTLCWRTERLWWDQNHTQTWSFMWPIKGSLMWKLNMTTLLAVPRVPAVLSCYRTWLLVALGCKRLTGANRERPQTQALTRGLGRCSCQCIAARVPAPRGSCRRNQRQAKG